MLGNSFGRMFRITTSGESYSGAFNRVAGIPPEIRGGLAVIIDGVPAGLELKPEYIQAELDKRRPGQSRLDTPRKEEDRVFIFSGVMEDCYTTGAPVCLLIPNSSIDDENIEKHRSYKDYIRPGHAVYTYYNKYGEYFDWLGGGRASGRETAARVAAGAVAKLVLDRLGIDVIAYVVECHGIKAKKVDYETAKKNYRTNEINCPDPEAAEKMIEHLLEIKKQGDSCGGVIEIIARGVPLGIGEPVFDKLSAVISHGLMSIGAVKGVEFGEGFGVASLTGSQSNDIPYVDEQTGRVRFKTNRAGGILGGISNGADLVIRVAVKPTPTIPKTQQTVNFKEMKNTEVSYRTRNDPSILPRIYPVCEAMVRIALLDSIYLSWGYKAVTDIIAEDKK